MSLRKKIVLSFLGIIVLAILAFVAYIMFSEVQNRDPFTAIPDDAIYIIETSDLTKGWAAISDSKMWKHMRTNKHFEDLSKSAASLDSLIKGSSVMDMIFSDRQMLISAHMISGNNYDFIFVINLKRVSKIVAVKDYINSIVGAYGYSMTKRTFEGTEITELTNNKSLEVLYIAFIDNLFVASYSPILIEKSIKQKDKNNWTKNTTFQAVAGEISSRKLFNFYFNYSLLSKYMGVYLSEESDLVNSLGSSLRFSAFNVNFEDERLSFSGYTNLADSVSSYLKALSTVSPGKSDGYKLVSDNAALYLSLCFDDFNDFYKNLTSEFSNEKNAKYEDYSSTVTKVEKLFKINLQDDFFSWIGNEIAFVKLKPVANAKENDVSILIHAKNIEDARTDLDHLTKQVKKRSPLKFDTINYKGYRINYLDIKGFFKMFFGKLFGKLEKPYFTYMDDYVVFSNSVSALMDMIDDYTKGKTLAKDEAFMKVKENFDTKSNVNVFVRMPEMYSHLYLYSNAAKRIGVHDNKELILSFSKVGFQLVSDGKMFKTTLIVDHDEDALYNEELERFENAAEDLYYPEFDSLKFKPGLSASQLEKDGQIEIKNDSGKILYRGLLSNGRIDGNFKTYYPDGNLQSMVNYRDGKVEGNATFYYDRTGLKVKAQMVFDEKEQMKGEYTEFYENGAKKAILEVEDGKLNGDATFYYDSGILKIEGSYKDGVKNGKWKNYTEDGNLLTRERFKKGQLKNSH